MLNLLKSNIGRLRILGFLEGSSLIILIFIAVPAKYFFDSPELVKSIGPIHGTLFLLFVLAAIIVAIQYKWKLTDQVWKVLLSCLIPFGTFYIDKKILKAIPA